MKEFCSITSSSSSSNQPVISTPPSTPFKQASTQVASSKLNDISNGVSFSPTLSLAQNDENTNESMEIDDNEEAACELVNVPQLVKRPLKLGEYWYVLNIEWYNSFLQYLKDEDNAPEKIDNSALVLPIKSEMLEKNNQNFRLRKDVRENMDYLFVPEMVWNLLVKTFDKVDGLGGVDIRCPVIARHKTYFQIEMYPLELRLARYGSKEDTVALYSRNCTLRTLINDMKNFFGVSSHVPVQLYNNATLLVSYNEKTDSVSAGVTNFTLNTADTLNNTATNVPPPPPPPPSVLGSPKTFNIDQPLLDIVELEAPNAVLTLEVQNDDGTWPSSRTRLGAITRSKLASGHQIAPKGVCGLMNLGNTCFMNAAIQCLSNTEQLTNYFLTDRYINDINTDNPLGMGGQIANRYAELIKAIWSGFHSSLSPRDFKIAVTQFAPQFSGFAHHDSQELMAFLLDGLHEDLNRVKQKPYIEMNNEIEQRPDEVVAKESWQNYKLRNDSIIIDTFHAQLKSTLVCPECELVSVTFDPFCYLSLPLPYKHERAVDIIFVPAFSKRPVTKIKLNSSFASSPITSSQDSSSTRELSVRSLFLEGIMIPKTGYGSDISSAVAKFLNSIQKENGLLFFERPFDPKRLVAANINECRVNRFLSSNDPYNAHLDEIVVYELDDSPISVNMDSGCQTRSLTRFHGYNLPVFIRQINANGDETVISRPFYINIKHLTFEDIQEAILKELLTFVSPNQTEAFLAMLSEKTQLKSINAKNKFLHSKNNSDGETDNDDEEMNADYEEEEPEEIEDEGVVKSRSNIFSITSVSSNGHNEFSVLEPGVRLESQFDTYLAVNINYKIVSKFFPRDINKHGHINIRSLISLPNANINNVLTLKECINQFTQTEKLGENDPWYCPRCKKHQMADKKFDIWSLPDYLIIHLKRFSYSRLHRDKLGVLVDFPIENLDMTPYLLHNPQKENFNYDLIGVSNHYGELGGGHYNAYVKNFLEKKWYNFNDSSVTCVADKQKVVTKAAYVLFYQRKR